ncbi:hypothetical protein [Nitratireductor sp. L15S-10]|uniref:hypothetical protein n=1 Tax=Nitratireductor sp. L15S-10 TaxID=3034028 RepID=UPI0038571BE5
MHNNVRKIRALANAGYRRTEIAETLDIRYQHVRKVLVDAGITVGMTRTVEIERAPPPQSGQFQFVHYANPNGRTRPFIAS